MPLRETAQRIPVQRGGNRCGVSRMLRTLEGDDLAWFRENLDSGADATWISKALASEGIRLSEGIIGHHRRRQCACWDNQ